MQAVAADKRVAALPDLPTAAEAGYAGFDTSSWQGVWAPAKTPSALITRLSADVVKVVALPDARMRFIELGMEPVGSSPAALARVVQADLAKWAKVIKAAGIRPE